MKNVKKRPSVGRAGTNGCFLVEIRVHPDGPRSLARRFITEEEALKFYNQAVNAYEQKARRERVAYVALLFETKNPKSTKDARTMCGTRIMPSQPIVTSLY